MNSSKRHFLTLSTGLMVTAFFASNRVLATVEEVMEEIETFTGGKAAQSGLITLTTPEIAENNNSVPVAVVVDSPMTDDNYVEAILILAEENPNPEVVTFYFSPASGEAAASTRMRLAKTQNVVAVAKMSNGEFYRASNNIKATIGGCGG